MKHEKFASITDINRILGFWKSFPFLKMLKWTTTCFIMIPLFYCNSIEALNKQGICISELRRIPDHELIEKQIDILLKNPLPTDEDLISNEIYSRKDAAQDSSTSIPYRTSRDFYLANPNCCTITRHNPESGYIPSEDERSFGSGRGYVSLNYKAFYKTKKSADAFINHKTIIPLNNCGNIWHSF